MTADLVVKVCVIGPLKAGKTLLCQTLAEQPGSLYSPTAGCRIQVLGRDLAQDSVTVQDVDGAILVTDPQHPEQEKELEQLYLRIVQPHNLTMKQCCVLAITQGEPNTTGSWSGLQGKLRKLPFSHVHISSSAPEHGRKAALDVLDGLLAGCIAHKNDKLETAVLGG